MIRDDELNRLMRYAQGMGISVRFKPYVKRSGTYAEWTVDGSEIAIYVTPKDSKINKILSLIHELGHQKGFVANERKIDPKVDEALGFEDNGKLDRKRILNMETEDASHWEDIYRDTNCQFNIKKLQKQREFDIWTYEVYYETGHDPTTKEKSIKKKELRKKYGC